MRYLKRFDVGDAVVVVTDPAFPSHEGKIGIVSSLEHLYTGMVVVDIMGMGYESNGFGFDQKTYVCYPYNKLTSLLYEEKR